MYERFWSYNTGVGLLWEKGRWAPPVECSFTWEQLNQQFLLAGINYEIEWAFVAPGKMKINNIVSFLQYKDSP